MMKRKVLSFLLTAVMTFSLHISVSAGAETACVSRQKLTVDLESVSCEVYNIDGYNYFKLRDLAYLLNGTGSQFSVGYDAASATASLTTGMAYDGAAPGIFRDESASAQKSTQTILVDGKKQAGIDAYNIGGYNFFKLRDLSVLLNFSLEYDANSNTTYIFSNTQNFSWTFNQDTGVLTITGSGPITAKSTEFWRGLAPTTVVIEHGLTSISDLTFYNCNNLTSITIPNSVTSIGYKAFACCHNLTSITFPDSITSIGKHAFYGCENLTKITIPDSITSIGKHAFFWCENLTRISVGSGNKVYSDFDGVLFNRDMTELIYCPAGKTGTFSIPYGLNSIDDYALYWCKNLTKITIPDSVIYIGSYAFSECSKLTSITIPDSVTFIGDDAFYGSKNLTATVARGSYGETYCKENEIPYTYS